MNREIKFRAFNSKDNEYYGTEVAFKILYDRSIGNDDNGNYTIEQFTGLQDKKGVNIYEGDIVRTAYEYVNEDMSIKYDSESAKFALYDSDAEVYYSIDSTYRTEVIGNIHTHPELL